MWRYRHGVQGEARLAAKKRETLPVDNAMMDLFNEMIQTKKDGGGITFDTDSLDVNEKAFATTLETKNNEEEGDGMRMRTWKKPMRIRENI
jgi:hypothetical protein